MQVSTETGGGAEAATAGAIAKALGSLDVDGNRFAVVEASSDRRLRCCIEDGGYRLYDEDEAAGRYRRSPVEERGTVAFIMSRFAEGAADWGTSIRWRKVKGPKTFRKAAREVEPLSPLAYGLSAWFLLLFLAHDIMGPGAVVGGALRFGGAALGIGLNIGVLRSGLPAIVKVASVLSVGVAVFALWYAVALWLTPELVWRP